MAPEEVPPPLPEPDGSKVGTGCEGEGPPPLGVVTVVAGGFVTRVVLGWDVRPEFDDGWPLEPVDPEVLVVPPGAETGGPTPPGGVRAA